MTIRDHMVECVKAGLNLKHSFKIHFEHQMNDVVLFKVDTPPGSMLEDWKDAPYCVRGMAVETERFSSPEEAVEFFGTIVFNVFGIFGSIPDADHANLGVKLVST